MTEKEKQIEEMAKITCRYKDTCINYKRVCSETKCENLKYAEALYNADYRKQSGWISVDERLPTEEEYRDEYGELIPILVTEKDTTYPYRALYDGKTWGDGLTAIPTITHWMPLPEPPKMKGGESDAR